MTPSKEALSAARAIALRDGAHAVAEFSPALVPTATLIDTAFAEHRERVRRLVEAGQEALSALMYEDDAVEGINSVDASEKLRAALAPFLEQETVTRLTPEREAEIRELQREWPEHTHCIRDLLAEIDALREERERLPAALNSVQRWGWSGYHEGELRRDDWGEYVDVEDLAKALGLTVDTVLDPVADSKHGFRSPG